MLSRFDCAELFGTVSGRNELLKGGERFGVQVGFREECPCRDNCIDFGSISKSDIAPPASLVPLGYTDFETDELASTQFVIDRKIFITNRSELRNVTLLEAEFLPKVKSGPIFALSSETYQEANGSHLAANDRNFYRVRINIGNTFKPAYLGKWLLLFFQGDLPRTRATEVTSVQFVMAVKITGCCVADSGNKQKGVGLSSESRPFIPRSMLNYFDNPVGTFLMPFNSLLPQSYVQASSHAWAMMPVPEMIQSLYHDALASRKVPEFIAAFPSLRGLAPLPAHMDEILEYLERLSLLACLEECHLNTSIKSYDMPHSSIKFCVSDLYQNHTTVGKRMECVLNIKGSQENRPKILIGDVVRVRSLRTDPAAAISNKNPDVFELQGIIKSFRLATEEAVVEFPIPPLDVLHPFGTQLPKKAIETIDSFVQKKLSALKYQVRFTFDRCGFGFIQESIRFIADPRNVHLLHMLFPSEAILPPVELVQASSAVAAAASVQQNVSLNEQQLSVVEYLSGRAKAMANQSSNALNSPINLPFVVFGPPGTGKTVTVVESIRQIIATYPSVKILACAPSDAAADVLCKRISKFLSPTSLFRLNWWQRIMESVPPDVLPYSFVSSEGIFALPPLSTLRSYQVIVATCGSSGSIRHANVGSRVGPLITPVAFDFVFIDEACQALEAEALVPSSFCDVNGQLVLAGDQFQLGPQPRSPVFALTNSLQSLQERILRYPRYSTLVPSHNEKLSEYSKIQLVCPSGRTPGVFLANNYRSHRDIFHVSSKLFYGNALNECAERSVINALTGLSKRYSSPHVIAGGPEHADATPMLFLGCRGSQSHELDSPSYFNELEISCVVSICSFLLRWEEKGISQQDIGVIAAYRSQILKLRIALRRLDMGRINVGSVEDFQGREVKIVIVSTVISDQTHLLHEPGLLGLIGDPKRFNVALTRGMSSTIVVGHPDILRMDASFRVFLDFCQQRDCCRGELWTDEHEDTDGDLAEADSLLNIVAETALGYGRKMSSVVFGGVDPMEAYYRDDIEWRTLL